MRVRLLGKVGVSGCREKRLFMFCFAERSRLLKNTRQPSQGAWCHHFYDPRAALGALWVSGREAGADS